MMIANGMYSEHERAFGKNGGDAQTSLMLNFRPNTVDMAAVRKNRSNPECTAPEPVGPIPHVRFSSDLSGAGMVGDAGIAIAERGEGGEDSEVKAYLAHADTVGNRPGYRRKRSGRLKSYCAAARPSGALGSLARRTASIAA